MNKWEIAIFMNGIRLGAAITHDPTLAATLEEIGDTDSFVFHLFPHGLTREELIVAKNYAIEQLAAWRGNLEKGK